ncbi:MAG: hypothetical protein ABJB49_01030 [Nitrospirota bacterium]
MQLMRLGYLLSMSLLLLAWGITGCSMFQRSMTHPVTSFFAPDPRDGKLYVTLEREADQLLGTCSPVRSCDRAHFIRGLVALYQSRETAADHFQTAVAMAPTSKRAEPSLFWLQLLKEAAGAAAEDGPFARATVQLVRDLLERELLTEQLLHELGTSPVQTLQRDLKARDKKLEDLTKQLEALKQIDQEMREKTMPNRPSPKTIPPRGKENP